MEHTGNGAFSHGSPRNYKSTARKEERPYLLRTQAWIVTILTFFLYFILTVYIRKYFSMHRMFTKVLLTGLEFLATSRWEASIRLQNQGPLFLPVSP